MYTFLKISIASTDPRKILELSVTRNRFHKFMLEFISSSLKSRKLYKMMPGKFISLLAGSRLFALALGSFYEDDLLLHRLF
jgi:hypothetical protein